MINRFYPCGTTIPRKLLHANRLEAAAIIGSMARGWESKAVEQQQAEAASASSTGPNLSPEERSKKREQESLRLSRQRIMQQLEKAHHAAHRQMLERALRDLDEKLAHMG
jgi:hypothetical protein